MKLKPHIIFDFLVLVFFVYFVWEAREWRLQARLYPWVIGIPMLFLAAIHLGVDVRGGRKKASEALPVDLQFAKGVDPALAKRRTLAIFSWVLGFLLGVWLVGFSISIAAMVFCYLRLQAREPWVLSVALTAGAWLVYWVLFERLLRLPLPEGQIFFWLAL